jgi:hypothetical protein
MWVLGAFVACTTPEDVPDTLQTPPTVGLWCAAPVCDADEDGSAAAAFGGTDCDDADPAVHVGANEVCNTFDDDCDGLVDDADPDFDRRTGSHFWPDADGDGFGGGEPVAACVAPTSYVTDSSDCDDTLSSVHPGGTEVCNGLDDDCDGDVDDGDPSLDPSAALTFFVDVDGDGYGDPNAPLVMCDAPGAVLDGTDCAPFDPAFHALVEWYTDADDDGAGDPSAAVVACLPPAGTVATDDDCDDADPAQHPDTIWYQDSDHDTFGDGSFWVNQCLHPLDYVLDATDCDDLDPREHPGALWYGDRDADGFGDASLPLPACDVWRVVDDSTDCDDLRADISPADLEVCDHADNDCDGTVDDGLALTTWYADEDLDGWSGDVVSSVDCGGAPGTHLVADDCDDLDPTVHPGAPQTCDELVDRDCDGVRPAQAYGDPIEFGFTYEPASGQLVDVDGDGDNDVAWSDAWLDTLLWSENDGDGGFSVTTLVSEGLLGVGAIGTADIDLDGDPDLYATFNLDDTVAWFQNQGDGVFGAAQVLSATLAFPFGVTAADLDLDGDPEIVATSTADDRIVWFDNVGGGLFGLQTDLTASGPYRVRAGDVDVDGDPDLVTVDGTAVRWFENLGNGLFGPETIVNDLLSSAYTLELTDLDGDGDVDVLTGEIGLRTISWIENLGNGGFGADLNPIATLGAAFLSHRAADLDADGDLDVIGCSLDEVVVWSENLGGATFAATRELTVELGVGWVDIGEIDGEAPADVLFGAWREDAIGWFPGEACEP